MIITCPRCLATYTVPDIALGAQGRKLRCSSCHFEWQETPPPQEAIANLAPPPLAQPPARHPAPPPPPKAEVKKPKPPAKPKSEKSGTTSVVVFAVFAAVLAGSVLMRNSICGIIPAMEDVYEGVGLPVGSPAEWFSLKGTGVESAEDGNRLTLTIHGEITNISKRERTLPPVRITWYGKDGSIGANTVVRPEAASLAPGAKTTVTGILNRVDTSAGGEVRMVPWLGSEAMVVTPEMQKQAAEATHSAPAPRAAPTPHTAAEPTPAPHDAAPAPDLHPSEAPAAETPAPPESGGHH